MNIEVLTNLGFDSDMNFLREYSDFPQNPSPRQVAVVNGVLYFYTNIRGHETWYPLTSVKSSKVHTQGVASTVWTVTHDFNTKNVGIFVYDANDVLQHIAPRNIQENSFEIHFTTPKTGRAVVFFDATMEIPAIVDMREDLEDISDKVDALIQGEVPEFSIDYTQILNKPEVVYQEPIAADKFTVSEVMNLKNGKLATGQAATSVMTRSPVIEIIDENDTVHNFNYLPDFVMVYLQRRLLRPTEYLATDGETIELLIDVVAGDELEIISLTE